MTNSEKVKHIRYIRQVTLSPLNKITEAFNATNGDVEATIGLLMKQMTKTDIAEMSKRQANATILYGYVHNNRIGAMVAIASQTDFVTKNELFLAMAKDICMHIVSTPLPPEHVSEADIPIARKEMWHNDSVRDLANKPAAVIEKIVAGKMQKQIAEVCLLKQPFIKDDSITVEQLIANVSAKTGEKIEIKRFVRMVAS